MIDTDIINFLNDEEDEGAVSRIKREAFEMPVHYKKIGPFDYLVRKGEALDHTNATLFESGGPYDDTKIDLVKVMHRF